MSRLADLGAKIPPEKIRALRETLERDGSVTFKNGSTVERKIDQVEFEDVELGAVYFLVTRPAGGIAKYTESEIISAYAMALRGPNAKPQPTPRDYGEDAPF